MILSLLGRFDFFGRRRYFIADWVSKFIGEFIRFSTLFDLGRDSLLWHQSLWVGLIWLSILTLLTSESSDTILVQFCNVLFNSFLDGYFDLIFL